MTDSSKQMIELALNFRTAMIDLHGGGVGAGVTTGASSGVVGITTGAAVGVGVGVAAPGATVTDSFTCLTSGPLRATWP